MEVIRGFRTRSRVFAIGLATVLGLLVCDAKLIHGDIKEYKLSVLVVGAEDTEDRLCRVI